MKKIGIIGAGISGLFIANLFKENPNYQVTIFEKKHSIELDEGYGIQLSTNSIKLLNKIGFNEIEKMEKFNPEKIDFYEIEKQKKISDLNISGYNSEDYKYTTMKRSILVEFLKNRLDEQVIKYKHSIEKIEKKNDQINLTFNNNQNFICDYLIISDVIFSKGKSLISNNQIQPSYNNCIAIRGKIPKANLNNLNKMNISLFVGPDFHYVIYPLDNSSEEFNFIGVLKHQLTVNELKNYSLFDEKAFIEVIKKKLQNDVVYRVFSKIAQFSKIIQPLKEWRKS